MSEFTEMLTGASLPSSASAWTAGASASGVRKSFLSLNALFPYGDALVIQAWLARGTPRDVERATALGTSLLSCAVEPGVQAWAGMAFARLYTRTRSQQFLQGALLAAQRLDEGAGTAHHILAGALLTMLAEVTGSRIWRVRAQVAFTAVAARWEPSAGHLRGGPAEVQNWAYLATLGHPYDQAVTWVLENLSGYEAGVRGIRRTGPGHGRIWLEGTAHTALALRTRNAKGDRLLANRLLWNIEQALPADMPATAWYLLAALGQNPLRL